MKTQNEIWGGFLSRIKNAVENSELHCDVAIQQVTEIGNETSKEFIVIFDCTPKSKEYGLPVRRVSHVTINSDLKVHIPNGIIAGKVS